MTLFLLLGKYLNIISISSEEFLAIIQEALKKLSSGDCVYCIKTVEPNFRGEYEFYLVPAMRGKGFEEITGDPEYGWPSDIEAVDIKDIYYLMPMPRKHPVVTVNGIPKAIGLQSSEFIAMYRE